MFQSIGNDRANEHDTDIKNAVVHRIDSDHGKTEHHPGHDVCVDLGECNGRTHDQQAYDDLKQTRDKNTHEKHPHDVRAAFKNPWAGLQTVHHGSGKDDRGGRTSRYA